MVDLGVKPSLQSRPAAQLFVRRMNPTLLFLNRHMLWKARGSNIPPFVRLICKAGYPPHR